MRISIYLFFTAFLFSKAVVGQTTLYDDPAGQSYTNIDDAITDVTPTVDISNCSTVEYSVSYEFPLGWSGPGNMESADECNFGDLCLGDPEDPFQGDCFECWDFMWIQFFADGDPVAEELIGEEGTFDIDNMGTFTFLYCRDDEEEAHIEITNQNWGSSETNIYTNVYIICLEGVPVIDDLEVACTGGDIDLFGTVDDDVIVQGWEWTTNGSGVIDNPFNQETFITGAMDGDEISLEATDQFGCMGISTVEVMVEEYELEISGGGILCENGCTDEDSDFFIEIDGGAPLYTLTLEINGFPVPDIPAVDISETFRICNDPDASFPSYDENVFPPEFILPSEFFPASIEITQVVDADGCEGVIVNGTVDFDLEPAPEIEEAESPAYCIADGGLIDLTLMNEQISPGGLTVLWFEDEELENSIIDPSLYPADTGDTVYAIVDDGECQSAPVAVELDVSILPLISLLTEPISGCALLDFILPDISEVADIDNAVNPGYYLDENGVNGPVFSIDPNVVDEVYIYDAASENCFAQVLVPLDISSEPDIVSPQDLLTGCGEVILPVPQGQGFDTFSYNSEEDGSGMDFDAGDILTEQDNIATIYLSVTAEGGCSAIAELDLDFGSGSIDYIVELDSLVCADSIVLPAIIPDNGTVSYFTASQGMGVSFRPGDIIYAPFNDTLYIWNPQQDVDCISEDTLALQLITGPEPVFPSDTAACSFLVLPEFGGLTGPNIRYARFPVSNPNSSLYPGDTVDFSQVLFVLDTIGDCQYFDSMQVRIVREPFIGLDTTLLVCEGFSSSGFDLMELISNPQQGGRWAYPSLPDFNPVDSSDVFLDVLPPGNYSFVYSIEDSLCGLFSSTLSVDIISVPYGGENNNLNLCTGAAAVDFMALINNPDSGGMWSQVTGPEMVSFTDSTSVDLRGLESGNYVFLYVIEGEAETEFCEPESASLFITIGQGVQAGIDTSYVACQGEIIDMTTLVSSDADPGGFFEGENIIFNGNSWNTSASPAGQDYLIQYIVPSQDINCSGDTALITVTLVDEISAGTLNPDLEFCEGDEVILSDIVENESPGGTFFFANSLFEVPGGNWTAAGDQRFWYIVEGMGSCPSDTLSFELSTLAIPRFDIQFNKLYLCVGSDDNAIEFRIVNENNLPINYEIRFYDNGTNDLAAGIDSLSSDDINFVVSGTEDFTGIRNDTLFLQLINNVYRLEVDAYTGSFRCQDEENIFTWIDINESYSETIEATLCEGQSIDFRGNQYQNSTRITVPGMPGSCDSVFILDITNIPQEPGVISGVFCEGDTLEVFGRQYTADRTGTELFRGEAAFGCDSIINFDIEFESSIFENIAQTLCPGEELLINNIIYNSDNPTGSDTLQSVEGCDSILTVMLDFYEAIPGSFTAPICPGESFVIGNEVFDEQNLNGTAILENASENGCDSTVNVTLQLLSPATSLIREELCPGQTLVIGGDVYSENNPSGMSILAGMAENGCDSIITVELDYLEDAVSSINENICPGQTLSVGSDSYDESNPSGTTVLAGLASNGCDSIVNVQLFVQQAVESVLVASICPGDSIVIGGDTYNQDNPVGITVLSGASFNGCDSIVNVTLNLVSAGAVISVPELCPGEQSGTLSITMLESLEFPIGISLNGTDLGNYAELPVEIKLEAGDYALEIQAANGCVYTENLSILPGENGDLAIIAEMIQENSYTLNFSSSSSYLEIAWNATSGILNCDDCTFNSISIIEDTEVFLELFTAEGCILSTSILLQYVNQTRETKYYIPNIIDLSDPENNRFTLFTDGSVKPLNLRIYDRWGNLVHDQAAMNDEVSWDGRRNGRQLEQGVYVYNMTILTENGNEEVLVGQLTLIR